MFIIFAVFIIIKYSNGFYEQSNVLTKMLIVYLSIGQKQSYEEMEEIINTAVKKGIHDSLISSTVIISSASHLY